MNKKIKLEYCTICQKLYETSYKKQHLKTKKHHELLLQHNLKDENIEFILFSLTEKENEKENEEDNNIYYLPNNDS